MSQPGLKGWWSEVLGFQVQPTNEARWQVAISGGILMETSLMHHMLTLSHVGSSLLAPLLPFILCFLLFQLDEKAGSSDWGERIMAQNIPKDSLDHHSFSPYASFVLFVPA